MYGTTTNVMNLPEPLVRGLLHDNYTKGESNRSVTQLIDAPRIRILRHEHQHEITRDVSDLVWLALGKSAHGIFENAKCEGWNPEQRFFTEVLGWAISGQVDIWAQQERTGMFDYKVTSVNSYMYMLEKYDPQLNFYDWLLRQNGVIVDDLYIVFIFRDWKLNDYRRAPDRYPQKGIMVHRAEKWSNELQDEYVHQRVMIHQEAEADRLLGDDIPECTDEERWVRGDTSWEVVKEGNMKGKRFYSEEGATKYASQRAQNGDAMRIDVHEPKAIRCADYCEVSQFCDQYQKELRGE